MSKPSPMCGKHNAPKTWLSTVFQGRDDGITVRVPSVYACVCQEDIVNFNTYAAYQVKLANGSPLS